MTITTRAQKGSELTWNELDTNFTELRDGANLMVPKTQNSGIKVDSTGTPSYAWHDLHSTLHTDPSNPATAPSFVTYQGNIKSRQFDVGDEAFIEFHLPHDYVMGSEIFIHSHWSHTSSTVTGGNITWGFELLYAKGHNQQAFSSTPVDVAVLQAAPLIQRQHMVAETSITSESGSATSFPVAVMEPDGILICRVFLDANNIQDSVTQPKPFLHFVDLHYQTTNVGTKNKSPSFWA